MITVEHRGPLTIVGVFGEMVLADYRVFEREVLEQLDKQGELNLLIDLRAMLDYSLDVALEDVKFTRANAHAVGRIAVLSDRERVKWSALLSQLFLDSELQVFTDEAAARAWLAGNAP